MPALADRAEAAAREAVRRVIVRYEPSDDGGEPLEYTGTAAEQPWDYQRADGRLVRGGVVQGMEVKWDEPGWTSAHAKCVNDLDDWAFVN